MKYVKREIAFFRIAIIIIAIIPPQINEYAIEYNTKFIPMIEPIAQNNFISPAPSILSANSMIRRENGIRIPRSESKKPFIPER
jgi:hypothetical protein